LPELAADPATIGGVSALEGRGCLHSGKKYHSRFLTAKILVSYYFTAVIDNVYREPNRNALTMPIKSMGKRLLLASTECQPPPGGLQ
jgi:hypothetical protein